MARYTCERCGVVYHVVAGKLPDGEATHLCADVAARAKRQSRYVDAVLAEFRREGDGAGGDFPVHLAEAIVKKLMNMGVTND